ncbi:10141_t:CDS:2 [Entrophospora sp. SA101]|nr:10141_t:CDS:2 [Entrophospora sp. SA101]CAJ0925398.1 8065_t:CDS:2 [Entrophospora sp. SA101]
MSTYLMNELAFAIINNQSIFVSEIELDECDSEGDDIEDIEEVEETITEFKIQESSAKTIWSLISIVHMLTEQAFKGTIFTDKEKTVSANIVNFLWPFVQKHTIDNHLPEPHILIYAPLAALANYIATITAAGVYDVPVDDTNWITNSNQAEKNKPVIFLTQIKYRKAKPGKAFIKLNFEARIKGKKGNVNISKFTPNTEMSISKIEATAEKYTLQVKDLTKILTPLHKEISQLELQRMDLVRKVGRTAWDPGSANYQKLKEIRHEIATKQFEAIKLEKALAKARNKTKKKFLNGIKKEDYIEKMDLLPVIMRHLSSQKRVVFLGTDPGTIITSITSPRPLETIFADINCFNILASLEDNSQNDNDNSELTPHKFDVEFLPKPFKITSGLINNVTFLKKHQKKTSTTKAWHR